MFSLVQGFYDQLTYLPERSIALLGVECSGKSCILEWIKIFFSSKPLPPGSAPRAQTLEKMIPTVGLNVAKLHTSHERLLFWDLGGSKPLRPIWDRYVQEAGAIIWVVDSADDSRMQDSKEALKKLVNFPHLKHSPLLVLANKQDLNTAIDPVQISLALDLLADAESRPQCVQPCSGHTGEGVKEGVEWLMASLRGDCKIGMRIP